MARKHITLYWERSTGLDRRKGNDLYDERMGRGNEEMFILTSHEKYIWRELNNRLRGEF